MRHLVRQLAPALLVALGLLAGTGLAAAADGGGWLIVGGTLVVAGAIVGAAELALRLDVGTRSLRPASWLLAASVLLACGLVACKDPGLVEETLPLVGAGAAWLVACGGLPERACRRRAELGG